MTIENEAVVDAIGLRTETGSVHLTIADHLPWDGEHLLKLQSKLNRYLAFLESGEIYAAYPKALDRSVVVDVVCQYRPTEAAQTFIAKAADIFAEAGFDLRYGPLGSGYIDDDS